MPNRRALARGPRLLRDAAARIGLLVFGLLLALACIELGIRLLAPRLVATPAHRVPTEEESIYQLDRQRGLHTLQPNVCTGWSSGELRGTLTTNSLGFRGPEFTPPPTHTHTTGPPDSTDRTHRILVLGDSFVFGWGVDDTQTLPSLLSERLNAHADGSPYTVFNFGVPGYSPGRLALALREYAPEIRPDLIIIVVSESNDVLNDLVFARDPVSRTREQLTGIWTHSYLARLIYFRLHGLFRWARMTSKVNVNRTLGYIADIAEACRNWHIPCVVALYPARAQLETSGRAAWTLRFLDVEHRLHGRLCHALRQHPHVDCLFDVKELFISSGEDSLYYRWDGHPTGKAYAMCADWLEPRVRALLAAAGDGPSRLPGR